MTHKQLGIASAIIWLCCSTFLLFRGVSLLLEASNGLGWGAAGVLLGFVKGKLILERVAARYVRRIEALPNPSPLRKVYGLRAFVLLALMIGLGITLRALGAPVGVRGMVLVAVGCGLILGATATFRSVPNLTHFA